jgi:hypothetical protein
MYPATSNFQSGEPYAAWFARDLGGGHTSVCATQGRSFIKALQRALNASRGSTRVPSVPIFASIAVDGNWGPDTQQALVYRASSLAQAYGNQGWQTFTERLSADLTARTISRTSLQFALWWTYARAQGTDIAAVAPPQDAVAPLFGHAPDDDRGLGNGELTCWDPSTSAGPAVTGRDDVDRSQGRTPPPTTTPPGYVPPATPGTRAAGTGGLGRVVGFGLLAAGAVAVLGGGAAKRRRGGTRKQLPSGRKPRAKKGGRR